MTTGIEVPTKIESVAIADLKVSDFASEETLCFQCDVLINGTPMIRASNEGHGGCHDYDGIWTNPKDAVAMRAEIATYRTLMDKLKAHVRALPKWAEEDEFYGMEIDLLIDDLLTDALTKGTEVGFIPKKYLGLFGNMVKKQYRKDEEITRGEATSKGVPLFIHCQGDRVEFYRGFLAGFKAMI